MARRNILIMAGLLFTVGAALVTAALTGKGKGHDETYQAARSVVAVAPLDPTLVPSDACIGQLSCLRQWYQTLAWSIGPEAALKALDEHGVKNEELREKCHDTTHAIGEVAAYMRPISQAMELGDSNCGSGYYHGVIATTTVRVEPEYLIDTLVNGCADGKGFARWECYHGVGHGFVFAAGGDIYRGIESCLAVRNDSDRGACGSGAFMQELVDHGEDKKYAVDPYMVCKKMSETIIAGQCYDMLANIVYIHRSEPREQFAVCESLDEPSKSDCYRGLGRARFAGMPFEGSGIEAYCGEAGAGAKLCFQAAYSNTAAYYGNNEEAASHCPELSTEALQNSCREWFDKNPLG